MVGNYKVITLCGSTKFKEDFIGVQKELTLQGNIVISVGLFGHADGDYQNVLTEDIKIMLDDMHKRKIDMADEIFVINKNGYIGNSTRSEIEYAIKTGKKVRYLENKYVVKTSRGYIKGDLRSGVIFVDKENARQFNDVEIALYGESIAQDMFDFYDCKDKCEFELV